jgi:hypothetical protein
LHGNFIALDLSVEGKRISLVTVYGPNTDEPEFYDNIFSIIDRFGNDSFTICGDLNLVLDPVLDYHNYKTINNRKARDKLLHHMSQRELFDPYREFNPELKRYTWRRSNPLQQARLDLFIVSNSFLPYVKKCDILPSVQSDHSLVYIDIQLTDFKHGKGLWKHNNSLLKDISYLEIMNKKIDEITRQYAIPIYNMENLHNISNNEIQFVIDDQLFLDTLLMELRGKSISYAAFKKRNNNTKEQSILENIRKIETQLNENNLEELHILKTELNDLQQEKLEGNMIRARIQKIIDDEKASNFFCNLEKNSYLTKTISKLQTDEELITDQAKILKECEEFYSSLFQEKKFLIGHI